MTRYGPQSCPSTRRGAPGRGGSALDAAPVDGRVAGPGERFRPGGQQARRAQTFGCIRRQLPPAPWTSSRQVGHRFGHHIPRLVWPQISPLIWIRQNRRPGLRTQRLNEMADLVVDVPPIGNGFRDALAQQGLKPASETMHRSFDRAFRRPEAGRHGGVAAQPAPVPAGTL